MTCLALDNYGTSILPTSICPGHGNWPDPRKKVGWWKTGRVGPHVLVELYPLLQARLSEYKNGSDPTPSLAPQPSNPTDILHNYGFSLIQSCNLIVGTINSNSGEHTILKVIIWRRFYKKQFAQSKHLNKRKHQQKD